MAPSHGCPSVAGGPLPDTPLSLPSRIGVDLGEVLVCRLWAPYRQEYGRANHPGGIRSPEEPTSRPRRRPRRRPGMAARPGRSRLGVGLSVAGNPRRHLLLTNVPPDLDFLRSELESLIAELDPDT